jgi:hypothetical protein
MRSDTLFPSTHATWITVQLDALEQGDEVGADRALRELRDHVMRRYYEPLSAYLSATGYRDGDGIVGGSDLAIVLGSWGACP